MKNFQGHAYSITGIRSVDGPDGQECILRIRNPWGNEAEWNGRWFEKPRSLERYEKILNLFS